MTRMQGQALAFGSLADMTGGAEKVLTLSPTGHIWCFSAQSVGLIKR